MAGLGFLPDLVQQSACPQVFALAPSRLQDAIPSSPSLPEGRDLSIKAADGDLMFVLPLPQGAQGCPLLPCGSSSACDEETNTWKGHLRPPHHSSILSVWLGTPSSGRGQGLLSKESWEGPGSWGCQEGSAWLRELSGVAELGTAAAARDRGEWEWPLLATLTCHSLHGSQQDGLTQVL